LQKEAAMSYPLSHPAAGPGTEPSAGTGRAAGRDGRARVRVPADVERDDELAFGLTARQVAILAVAGAGVWAAWRLTIGLVPPLVFAAAMVPVAALAAALALGRRDGLGLDRYALAALAHARTPKRAVHAPEGIPDLPDVIDPALAPRRTGPAPVPADPIAKGVTPAGVVDLGRDGLSALAAVGTVNFTLRTPAEQEALVGAFATWLNSLDAPVQILVRADRADLSTAVTRLREQAPALPHPELEAAALEHAGFLADLAAGRDLLHRQVLLTHHRPPTGGTSKRDRPTGGAPAGGGPPGGVVRRLLGGGRPARAGDDNAHGEAARVLARRVADTARLLAAADLSVTALDGPAATAVLAAAAHPDPGLPAAGLARAATADDLTPHALEVTARTVRVGGQHVATLAVTGYPAEVGLGWLEPLLTYPGRLDVAVHLEPVTPAVAADRLRKQRARLESTRRLAASRGRLGDPLVDAAADDAADLAQAVARGTTRLFRVGIYLSVHAATADALAEAVARVRTLAASLLLATEPATWRAVHGWVTTLPLGVDALKLRRTLDTAAIAAAFPFTSPDLPAADPARPGVASGVLYGVNAASTGLIVWDRWTCDNYNSVTLARSGAGKSYLTKLDILRSLFDGVQVAVIDPETEYARLAQAVGGTVLHLGRPGVHLNPLDLPGPRTHHPNPRGAFPDGPRAGTGYPDDELGDRPDEGLGGGLGRRALFVQTFLGVALGGLDPSERAALDQAVRAAYRAAGIGDDPRTWARPAPLLGDVAALLAADTDPATSGPAHRLAARLAPYVSGSYAGLFNAPTSTRPDGHLVVYCLRDVPEELKTLVTLLTLDRVWAHVTDPTDWRRRLVVVDEAWLLMRDPAGADFLFRMAKAARKHWAGLAVITQDAADLLGTDLGQAVVANAATQILMRQAPQAIDAVADAFALSAGERQVLLTAPPGRGLLVAGGTHRVAFHSVCSPAEHRLATSKPSELAAPTPPALGEPR
jgi:hypothetical protein